MNNMNEKSPNQEKSEIEKITRKLMIKYEITEKEYAQSLAITLYEYGIGSDKFNDLYYEGLFNLNEIIIYLMKKKSIINFQKLAPQNNDKLNNSPAEAEIIPFPSNELLKKEEPLLWHDPTVKIQPKIKCRLKYNK